jgi:hypothetical protein
MIASSKILYAGKCHVCFIPAFFPVHVPWTGIPGFAVFVSAFTRPVSRYIMLPVTAACTFAEFNALPAEFV